MDLNRKLEMLTQGIKGISQHTDEPKAKRLEALGAAADILADEMASVKAETDPAAQKG